MGRPAARAVFLDRDGVLIEDVDLLQNASQIRVLPGVAKALARLKEAGFVLLVVSNQTVVARGLLDEAEVLELQGEVEQRLMAEGAPPLDGVYLCPHHPNATLPEFRRACDCRKPRPGLLLRAALEHGVDLAASFMVGDRPTDILAGEAAGCRTIWVETGCHQAARIETPDQPAEPSPDYVCAGMAEAADWILGTADR